MRRAVLGDREGPPAYFDLSAQHGPLAAYVGQKAGFRIGDRAAAFAYLRSWRQSFPSRRLIILDDAYLPNGKQSRTITAEWMFADLADEIWATECLGEPLPAPPGDCLYCRSMWWEWAKLRQQERIWDAPEPAESSLDWAKSWLSRRSLNDFITVQPLWNAGYDIYRNRDPWWWQSLIDALAISHPVVVLSLPSEVAALSLPTGAYAICDDGFEAMDSLALISMAKLHIGGETGLTLWAPIFRTPTIALYADPAFGGQGRSPSDPFDTRPIAFGSPLALMGLNASPDEVCIATARISG